MRKIFLLLLSFQFMAAPILALPSDDEERAALSRSRAAARPLPADDATASGGGGGGGHEIEGPLARSVEIQDIGGNVGLIFLTLPEGTVDLHNTRSGEIIQQSIRKKSEGFRYCIVEAASSVARLLPKAFAPSTPSLLSLSVFMADAKNPWHVQAAQHHLYSDYAVLTTPLSHGEEEGDIERADGVKAIRAHFKEAEKLEKYVPCHLWFAPKAYAEDTVMVVDEVELPAFKNKIERILGRDAHTLLVDLSGSHATTRTICDESVTIRRGQVVDYTPLTYSEKPGDAFLFMRYLPHNARNLIITNTAGDITQTCEGFLGGITLERVKMSGFAALTTLQNFSLASEKSGEGEVIFGFMPSLTKVGCISFGGKARYTVDLSHCTALQTIHRSRFTFSLDAGRFKLPPHIDKMTV